MNQNENKKTTQSPSGSPNGSPKAYSGDDIFDFDALRKAKAESAAKAAPAARPAQRPAGTSALNTQGNRQAPRATSSVAQRPAAGSASPRVPSSSKNDGAVRKTTRTSPNVTDVRPDKVVFDASVKSARAPASGKKKTKTPKIKPIKPVTEKTRGANPIAVLSKALLYIVIVFLVSCLCAYFIIVVANDVFAFVKADAQIEVVIPEYATLDQISEELHEKNVIKYPKIFVLYTMIRGKDPGEYKAGIFTVSPTQNYDELLSTFVERKTTTMTEISVTIPEGYTIDDMIKLFVEEKGMGTKEGFVDAIQNGEYDYWFINELTDLDPNRKYRLEGYLYPDTYYFYKEWPEEKIINKMLANFYSKFDIKYKQECEKAGKTVDYIVNLASIIQMEAKYTQDYTLVSSVIHNRLSSAYYMYRLDCDATIQYILDERVEDMTHEHTQIDNPYNTYRNSGLPPGPISNPTLKAIRAALYPESSSYYFFVSDITGHMLYGRNMTEHNANIAKVEQQYADAKRSKED